MNSNSALPFSFPGNSPKHQFLVDGLCTAHPGVQAHGIVSKYRNQRSKSLGIDVLEDEPRANNFNIRPDGYLLTISMLCILSRHQAPHHIPWHECPISQTNLQVVRID